MCFSRCKKNSCYFCDFCDIYRLLVGLLCLINSKYFLLSVKFVILAVLAIFASMFFSRCKKKLLLLLRFLRHLRTSRGPSLPYKLQVFSLNLLNLLFLQFLRYLLACVFMLQEKFLLLLRFLRHLRTSRGPSLPYKLQSFLLLNLLFLQLFLRYLLACVFTLQEKVLLLLRFSRHLRTSRGPSLPYKLQVFSCVKFIILAILAIFASQLLPKFLVNHLLLKLR